MKPCLISSHLRFCGTLALSLLSGAASTASEMSADAPPVLDPIEVHSTRGESYNVKHAAVATKTDTPLLDTPQSVSVLSKVHRLEVLKGASTKSPETVIQPLRDHHLQGPQLLHLPQRRHPAPRQLLATLGLYRLSQP
jgi:hypothetical protein